MAEEARGRVVRMKCEISDIIRLNRITGEEVIVGIQVEIESKDWQLALLADEDVVRVAQATVVERGDTSLEGFEGVIALESTSNRQRHIVEFFHMEHLEETFGSINE